VFLLAPQRTTTKFCYCEERSVRPPVPSSARGKQSPPQASKILSLRGAFCVTACPELSEREAISTTDLQNSVIARERSVRPQQSPAWANKNPVRVGWVERSSRNPTNHSHIGRVEHGACQRFCQCRSETQ
jgi:hypothetical protein